MWSRWAFLRRAVFLPVLFRLHIPNSKKKPNPDATVSKTEAARALLNLLARAFPDRRVHLVADALYRGRAWRNPPANTTFTTRLASNAVLYDLAPAPTGRRGHPAWKGKRLGTPTELAADATWRETTVTRYDTTETVQIAVINCLWRGSLHRTPVHVVLVRDIDPTRLYDIALITTDLDTTPETIVERYAERWSEEQTIKDCKELLGTGDAQNHLRRAVERTVPFTMLSLTILVLWYTNVGDADTDAQRHHALAVWYRTKRHISIADLLTTFRRTRITSNDPARSTPDLLPTEPQTWTSAAT